MLASQRIVNQVFSTNAREMKSTPYAIPQMSAPQVTYLKAKK